MQEKKEVNQWVWAVDKGWGGRGHREKSWGNQATERQQSTVKAQGAAAGESGQEKELKEKWGYYESQGGKKIQS